MDGGNTTATAVGAWFVHVGVSVRGGLVESEVVQGFLPGFSETEKVKVIVNDEFMEDERFGVERPGIEQGKLHAGISGGLGRFG